MGEGQDNHDLRLAERLAELRVSQGWSLEQLAQMTGISRATLSRVERAETSPTASLLGKLSAAYGLTTSRLLMALEDNPRSLSAHRNNRCGMTGKPASSVVPFPHRHRVFVLS